MDDIEGRLRAAMQAAAELPPPGLTGRVRDRHRRHVRRVTAAWVASVAVVAIAVPPTAHLLGTAARQGQRSGGTVASSTPAAPGPSARSAAAVGTVLAGCDRANPGAIGSTWHGGLRAGPLYFTPKDAAISAPVSGRPGNEPQLYAVVVVLVGLKPGSTAVVRPAPAGRGQVRFLFGPADSLAPGTSYTMQSGESGVTFEACPPGTGFADQQVTDYYGGFLIRGNRCVPIEVWAENRGRPFHASLGACR